MSSDDRALVVLETGLDCVGDLIMKPTRERIREQAMSLMEACESPIERLFVGGLAPWLMWMDQGGDFVRVTAQKQIENFRVDFAIEAGRRATNKVAVRLVIECDGHDFHERTKEQARKDKSRDRALAAAGWTVMRFTGSELTASPGQCGAEICSLILSKLPAPDLAEYVESHP